MKNPFDISDRTYLVTGASSGIGRQVATSLASLGAHVFVTGRDNERLQSTLDMLPGNGHICQPADLNNPEDLYGLLDKVPVLDGVVHAAGILKVAPLRILTEKEIAETFNINFVAPFTLLQTFLKNGKIRPGGSAVLIASVNGIATNIKGFGLYASSKAALESIARSFALEYAGKQIRFNTIAPGMIKTEMLTSLQKSISPANIAEDKKKYPLGDYGEPADVANACIYLLSDAGKWVTGTTLVVDGGLTII